MDDLRGAISKIFGPEVTVTGRTPLSGGDINEAFRLMLSDGSSVFMKRNRRMKPDFFTAEANGLLAISDMGAIGTAKVLCVGCEDDGPFLLLEYINEGRPGPDFFEKFGRELAALHLSDASEYAPGRYGFHQDNYIGATPQYNMPCDSWADFYRRNRLIPQFKRASSFFDPAERKKIEGMLSRLEEYLPEPERPSLLHGDLWAGNYMTASDGSAVLIDPASYIGDAETDLAMTELFGGFPKAFYDAYHEVIPIRPGYAERRELYQLYHLLNHLNLFGASYLMSVLRIVGRFG